MTSPSRPLAKFTEELQLHMKDMRMRLGLLTTAVEFNVHLGKATSLDLKFIESVLETFNIRSIKHLQHTHARTYTLHRDLHRVSNESKTDWVNNI